MGDPREEALLRAERCPRCVLGERNIWGLCHRLERSEMVLCHGERGKARGSRRSCGEAEVRRGGGFPGEAGPAFGAMEPVQRQQEGVFISTVPERCSRWEASVCPAWRSSASAGFAFQLGEGAQHHRGGGTVVLGQPGVRSCRRSR